LANPGVTLVFQGCSVVGFGGRVAFEETSGASAGVSAAAFARAADAAASSFCRQQCLYLRPDPQ
jgi:hypothetical protein